MNSSISHNFPSTHGFVTKINHRDLSPEHRNASQGIIYLAIPLVMLVNCEQKFQSSQNWCSQPLHHHFPSKDGERTPWPQLNSLGD